MSKQFGSAAIDQIMNAVLLWGREARISAEAAAAAIYIYVYPMNMNDDDLFSCIIMQ